MTMRLTFLPRNWQNADPALVAAIALLPLGWGTLIRIGPYSLEPFHVALLLLVGAAFCRPSGFANALHVVREFWIFFVGYGIYFFLQFFSYIMTRDAGGLDFYVVKQLSFLAFGMAAAVRVMSCRSITATLHAGGVLSIIAFLVAMQISASFAGTSAIDAFVKLATTGNYHTWTWGFLTKVFNAFSNRSPGGAEQFVSALKNNIGTGLLITLICFRAGAAARPASRGRVAFDYLLTVMFVVCILMMLSRSVMLAMLICVLIVYLVDAIVRQSAAIVIVILGALGAGLVLFLALPDTLLQGLGTRFFQDTGSFDARIQVYDQAIPHIENHFWTGTGIGSQGEGDYSIHNLFLSAWYNAGVFAFVGAVVFWAAAMVYIGRHLLRIAQGAYAVDPQLALFHAWIAVLPITGLFRCWLIGGGVLNFSAWFSIGIFFGVLCREAMAQRAQAATRFATAPRPAGMIEAR